MVILIKPFNNELLIFALLFIIIKKMEMRRTAVGKGFYSEDLVEEGKRRRVLGGAWW